MAWLVLILAGLFEIGWAVGLKYAEGFTRPLPTVVHSQNLIGTESLTISVLHE
jgi:quaternary ammonium compound-resistance protein SugE